MAWTGLDTRLWNLTMGAGALVVSACGPSVILPGETGGETDSVGSESDTDTIDPTEPTTVATTVGPDCEIDSDCDSGMICDGGTCVPDDYCDYDDGCCYYAEGPDGTSHITHCSPPPYYDCYDDSECGIGSICEYGYCNDLIEIPACPALEMIPVPIDGEGEEDILSLAFVDVDGDGSEDLIIGRASGPELLLAPGTGPATSLPSSVAANGIAGGDFDGDGDSDLALVDDGQGGRVSWILGDGQGGFAAGGEITGQGATERALPVDFNGDGALDLVLDHGSAASVALGDGAAGSSSHLVLETSATFRSVDVADFNVDGFTDVAISNESSIELWFGSDPPDSSIDDGTTPSLDRWLNILAGDFDVSSQPDLLGWRNFVSHEPWIYVEAFAEGTSNQGAHWFPGEAGLAEVGDLDGDGDPDVILSGAGALTILVSNGNRLGLFVPMFECQWTTSLGRGAQTMAIGDLDGDGRDEVALGLGTAVTVYSLL